AAQGRESGQARVLAAAGSLWAGDWRQRAVLRAAAIGDFARTPATGPVEPHSAVSGIQLHARRAEDRRDHLLGDRDRRWPVRDVALVHAAWAPGWPDDAHPMGAYCRGDRRPAGPGAANL